MDQLDAAVADVLADWNIYTTIFAGVLAAFAIYSVVSSKDPDIHPYLLARQSTSSPVRQAGESATYRSLETPYGYPLRSGLNIRDPGAPKWTAGRRGDLRDIWRTAVLGALNEDGTATKKQSKIYTVLGRNSIEHSLDQVTQEINVMGRHLQSIGVKNVAICLTDSVELLAAIFAGAFYQFKVTLVPHNLPANVISAHLQKIQADGLIAEAGSLDLPLIIKDNNQLSQIVWVAKEGNRHMDWHGAPEDKKDSLKVDVWHELVEEGKNLAGFDIPEYDPKTPSLGVSTAWPSSSESGDFINFESANIVAAVSALMSALPRAQRFTSSDVVLSIDSLSRSYPLCQVLGALFSGASIALNSVAGEDVDFALATMGLSPTVIIASSRTIANYHDRVMKPQTGFFSLIGRWVQSRTLDAGNMPSKGFFAQLAGVSATSELSLEKLRLMCISHRVDADISTRLTSEQLTDFRIFTGARIVYGLTGRGVAGAITQTNVFDYRCLSGPSHFGPPLSSVEVTLTDVPEGVLSGSVQEGQITVFGPAVVGEKTTIATRAHLSKDYTMKLSS